MRALLRDAADEPSAVLLLKALANRGDADEAIRAAEATTRALPMSAPLQFMHAVLLVDAGRFDDAARALRRVLYLDPSSVIGHFVLGTLLRRQKKVAEARRAYRNARDLARALPPEEALALGEGARAGDLAEMAEAELALLDDRGDPP